MMKPVYRSLLLLSSCLTVASLSVAKDSATLTASNSKDKKPSLSVVVDGIRNNAGDVAVTLCLADQAFPSGCTISEKSSAQKGKTTISFAGLEDGEYAAALFHDENADGKLTFIQEGIAFSNNSNLEFGPPKFEPAKFTVSGNTVINIDMRYFN
ncbi:DUF2141 domain-containing protein [Glaciecola sp. MH2013]|uniref:DUF2141 domain-containing protein n=1 Tax=Glaciecola sp. MH2013 TaxID=2785524 RepID=UPI0018A07CFA|nr:DUF2141 domain-containing protein [Glaciecola sp. MH2013]MBF7073488.1 DUF2141 domain-containing protein [Glaciecola sp. MH2013]